MTGVSVEKFETMRLCTVEDFEKVGTSEAYYNMAAFYGAEHIVCPDYGDMVISGSLSSGNIKTASLEVIDCIEDCETDPVLITEFKKTFAASIWMIEHNIDFSVYDKRPV